MPMMAVLLFSVMILELPSIKAQNRFPIIVNTNGWILSPTNGLRYSNNISVVGITNRDLSPGKLIGSDLNTKQVSITQTNGQLIIGNGGSNSVASLTAGANIFITNGAGTITIASSGGGGGGTPGGDNMMLQLNQGGSFGGATNLLWDLTNNILLLNGKLQAVSLTTTGASPGSIIISNSIGTDSIVMLGTNTLFSTNVWFGGLLNIFTNAARFKGGITNDAATASALVISDANKGSIGLATGGSSTVVHGTTPPTYSAVVEGDLSLSDITTANASTSNHGLVKKLPNDATKYYDGTGNYSIPAGSGSLIITSNDFSLNTRYTNISQISHVRQNITLSSTVTDNAKVSLFIDLDSDGTYDETANSLQVGAAIAMSDIFTLSGWIPANAAYLFTNQSAGSATAVIVSTSGRTVYGFGGTTNTVVVAGTNITVQTNGNAYTVNSSAGGSGTVTSVALSAPSEFSVSGSPVTTSGTLTFAKANQNANLIYVGPSSGSAAAPTFRLAVNADRPSRRQYVEMFDEMIVKTTGDFGWGALTSGAGAAETQLAGETNAPGINELSTGTTTTGYCLVYAANNSGVNEVLFGGGSAQYTLEYRFRQPTLFDGTDSGTFRLGFMDAANGNDPTDGIYVRFSNSGANFRYITRSSSTETDTDSGLVAVANTWYKIRIVLNSVANSVTFTIDDGSSQTVTTNIPSGAGRQTHIEMNIIKSAGTTARLLDVDYAWLMIDFNSAR